MARAAPAASRGSHAACCAALAAARERQRRERVAEERHRHRAAAELLGDERELEQLEAGAAVRLRHDEAGDADLGQPLPERGHGLALAVEDRAHRLRRALLRDEAPHRALEQLLFLGEGEIHRARAISEETSPGARPAFSRMIRRTSASLNIESSLAKSSGCATPSPCGQSDPNRIRSTPIRSASARRSSSRYGVVHTWRRIVSSGFSANTQGVWLACLRRCFTSR